MTTNVRRIVTERSVWVFDLDSQMATRTPLNESPDHPGIPYERMGKPFHFVSLGWFQNNQDTNKVWIRRASDGHRVFTGNIVSDSNPDLVLEDPWGWFPPPGAISSHA